MMYRLWLRSLARKVWPGRRLETTTHTVRRRASGLRLETLEERTNTSTLAVDPPELLNPAPTADIAIVADIATVAAEVPAVQAVDLSAPVPVMGPLAVAPTEADPPALDPLVIDPLPDLKVVVDLPTLDNSVSIPTTNFPAQTAPQLKSVPTSVPFSLDTDRAESAASAPILPLTVAQVERALAPPVSEADKPDVTNGNHRIRHSAPVPDTNGTPAAAAAPASERAVAPRPAPARPANGSATQASPEVLTVPPANRAVTTSRQPGTADVAAARGQVKRLPADQSDSSLLRRFVAHREQEAFTALVRRHERVVLGICQRVLGDSHAAQDAFQATFLVLARKASSLDDQGSLAAWLCKVAYHLALRLRGVTARRRRTELKAADGRLDAMPDDAADAIEDQEVRQALDEELQRLPDKYRVPLVLCYFHGRTHAEAAQAIGLPRGSMAKRIGEGLDRLRERLADRGVMA